MIQPIQRMPATYELAAGTGRQTVGWKRQVTAA